MIIARTIAKIRVLAAERRIRLAYADLDRVEESAEEELDRIEAEAKAARERVEAEIQQRQNAITVASSRLCEARADYRAITQHHAYVSLQVQP